jgi:hypothetical protein
MKFNTFQTFLFESDTSKIWNNSIPSLLLRATFNGLVISMGCIQSKGGGEKSDARRTVQAKAPILLFCLPGSARDALLKLISAEIGDTVNVRFIDMLNQRSARRYWLKELAGRKDYAGILYLGDARDHPSLVLSARSLNWFFHATQNNFDVKFVVLYDEEAQFAELKSYPTDDVEILGLSKSNRESVAEFTAMLQGIEKKFSEQRKTQTSTTTLSLL